MFHDFVKGCLIGLARSPAIFVSDSPIHAPTAVASTEFAEEILERRPESGRKRANLQLHLRARLSLDLCRRTLILFDWHRRWLLRSQDSNRRRLRLCRGFDAQPCKVTIRGAFNVDKTCSRGSFSRLRPLNSFRIVCPVSMGFVPRSVGKNSHYLHTGCSAPEEASS